MVLKDYAGQADQADSLVVQKDEIVFRTAAPKGDGWVEVRREHDGVCGLVPQKRVAEAPLPPPPEEDARAPPDLSSDDDDDEGAGEEGTGVEGADGAGADGTEMEEEDARKSILRGQSAFHFFYFMRTTVIE